jgi:hypothetical protein
MVHLILKELSSASLRHLGIREMLFVLTAVGVVCFADGALLQTHFGDLLGFFLRPGAMAQHEASGGADQH